MMVSRLVWPDFLFLVSSQVAVEALSSAFGDKLLEMEDNKEDEDVDQDLSDVEEEEDEGSIDGLTNELSKLGIIDK